MPRTRPPYPPEFKAQAVKLARSSEKPLSELARRIKHLSARANLPKSRFNRAMAIARELLSSRYHLYSKGINSAAKDFVSRSDTLS